MKDINKIIKQLQPIKVELEFDGNEGTYSHKGYGIEGKHFLVMFDLEIFQAIGVENATRFTPIQHSTIYQSICVEDIDLWIDEEKQELSDEDYNKLMKGIIKTIEL